jgi:carbon-monoxide dehydrogenase iron sulfur subunit
MPKVIVVNQPRCVACHTCELQCVQAHSDLSSLAEMVSADTPPRPRVTVEPVPGGSMPMQCRHCEEAACVLICPKDALSRDSADAPVVYDVDACIGCRFCMLVCPYGAVDFVAEAKKVSKCDLCLDRPGQPGVPACAEGCPTGAIEFLPLADHLSRRREEDQRIAAAHAPHAGPIPEDVKKVSCALCGCEMAPRRQLEILRSKLPEHIPVPAICPACRRRQAAELLAEQPATAGAAAPESGSDATR